jgi:hypothetical protein
MKRVTEKEIKSSRQHNASLINHKDDFKILRAASSQTNKKDLTL